MYMSDLLIHFAVSSVADFMFVAYCERKSRISHREAMMYQAISCNKQVENPGFA